MKTIKAKSYTSSAVLLLLLFLSFNKGAFAADNPSVGIVIASEGTVKAIAADKSERELQRGASFYSLETILVGSDSSAQLKFSDDTLVTLIQESEFRIDSYSFKAGDQPNESTSSLAKGGFRLLSGSIAKENPGKVTIKTPVATIGLQGTSIDAVLSLDGQLFVGCSEGLVKIATSYGDVNIGKGADPFATVLKGKKPLPSSTIPDALSKAVFTLHNATKDPDASTSAPEALDKDIDTRESKGNFGPSHLGPSGPRR